MSSGYSPVRILNAKNATLGLSRNTTFGHNNKKFEMRQRGFRGSEILFKCKQCHFRLKWKYNFGTYKPNKCRIHSPVWILNAKNAIWGVSRNATFGHTLRNDKNFEMRLLEVLEVQNTFQM